MSATTTTQNLETLADRFELTELVSRLGRWLDDPTSAAPEDLFADDVTVRSPGGEAQGRERVVAQARRTHDAFITQHAMTDVLADLHGDEATMTCNLVVAVVEDDPTTSPSPVYQSGTRYRLGARRTAHGWRLTRIEVAPVWQIGEPPVNAPTAKAN